MTRYKGQPKASRTEQEFPHRVDIIVPPGGLGTRLDAMYDFHAQHGIKPQRGQGKHDADGSVTRWCFADEGLATAFASKFGVTADFTALYRVVRSGELRVLHSFYRTSPRS